MGIEANPETSVSRPATEEAARQVLHGRASQAVIWGMPAVNFDRMLQAFIGLGGGPNQIAYWSKLLDSNNQTLTPNPDTVYFTPFYDTKSGPVVLEIPPADGGSITGSIDDLWQNALEDVGPAGADKGAGGKYLILPPGYKDPAPPGYIPLRSDTFQGFALLRSNVKSSSDADVAAAVAYGKRIRLYPLPASGTPDQTAFVDLAGKLYDATIPYDRGFFASLARVIAYEPWLDRDKAMIDPLASLGIAKGKPFAPSADRQSMFDRAANDAAVWIDTRREDFSKTPFYPGSHWALPADPRVVTGLGNFFSTPDQYPLDSRAVGYSMGYFSAKHLGTGQFYLLALQDREGRPFEGSSSYRLRVPANAPVDLYWSVTAYDRQTHALIKNMTRSSRASNSTGIKKNADGSVDIHFGPAAPEGQEMNWIPTDPRRKFELLFRLYGPRKGFFEKIWVLPDVERVNPQ